MLRVLFCWTFLHVALSYTHADESPINFTDSNPMALPESLYVIRSSDICPSDSEVVDGVCKCNLDLCEAPLCDKILSLVRNGTDVPGNCCPLYTCDNCTTEMMEDGTCLCGKDAFLNDKGYCECRDHHKSFTDGICICDPNKCELPLLCDKRSVRVKDSPKNDDCCMKTICKPCPYDSYPTEYRSDEIEEKCVCYPCPEYQCNDTHVPIIVRKGRNIPQQCCDLYNCIPKHACVVDNVTYANGESWITDDKQNCTCTNGLSLCSKPDTTDGIKHCLYHNRAYPNSTSWLEDACTNCTCINGNAKCISHLCNVTESKVQKYKDCEYNDHIYAHLMSWITDDLCTNCTCNDGVPNCDSHLCNVSIEDINNNNCPPMDNCKKYCKNGFKINRKGCEICKCKIPEKVIERYIHLEMYMKNHNLSETDVLQILRQKTKSDDEDENIAPPVIPGQNKDCNIALCILPTVILLIGALIYCCVVIYRKRKDSCNYSPVSKTLDNNNLPAQEGVKYISEKKPLKT